jgi:drug/metabolite transporter (DMT)-like permease
MMPAVVILALAAACLFALALVLTQFGLRYLSPLGGASVSIPATAVLFAATAPLTVDAAGWHAGGALLFGLAGLFFPVSVTLLTFAGNRRLGPSLTGALGNLTPLFAVAAAIVLVGEVPGPMQALGIAAIVIGVFLLFRWMPARARPWTLAALLLPVGAAALRGLAQPVVKLGLASWPDPFAAATVGYIVSAAVVLAVRMARRGAPERPDMRGILWFIAVGMANGGAVLAVYAALARGPVAVVAPLVATYPLAVLILERALLRRTAGATPAAIAGTASIVAGIVLLLAAR